MKSYVLQELKNLQTKITMKFHLKVNYNNFQGRFFLKSFSLIATTSPLLELALLNSCQFS